MTLASSRSALASTMQDQAVPCDRRRTRPCRTALREFRRGSAQRHGAALAQTKRITTASALRGISSSHQRRSRAGLAKAAGRARTSFCDRGSSHGSCACSASSRSAAALRQAVPFRTAARCLPRFRADLLLHLRRSTRRRAIPTFLPHDHRSASRCHRSSRVS